MPSHGIENGRGPPITKKGESTGSTQFYSAVVRQFPDELRTHLAGFDNLVVEGRGLRVLADFDLSKVSQFRSEWKDGPRWGHLTAPAINTQ
jgi:hypothetical protein